MKNINKSQLFKTAWFFIRKGIFNTLSDALKYAWKRVKIVAKLKSGVVNFTFRKSNGELRNAIGTLNSDLFSYESKTDGKNFNPDVIKYFDMDKNSFRSFRIERLVF